MRDMQMLGRSEVLAGTTDASGQNCPVVAVICWRVGECGLGDEDPDRFSIWDRREGLNRDLLRVPHLFFHVFFRHQVPFDRR